MSADRIAIQRFCDRHRIFIPDGWMEDSKTEDPVPETYVCDPTHKSKHRTGYVTEGSMTYCPFKTAEEAKECPAYSEINWLGKLRNRILY